MAGYLLLAILGFSLVAFYVGRTAGTRFAAADGNAVPSLPGYHGAFVAVWVGIPALVLVLLWLALQGAVIDGLLLASLPASLTEAMSGAERNLILSEIRNVAAGRIFSEPDPAVAAAAESLVRWEEIARWAMVVVALAAMTLAMVVARRRLSPRFRARTGVERFAMVLMILCATAAV